MGTRSLLQEFVMLVVETMHEHPQAPFDITGPVTQAKREPSGAVGIMREFPLRVSPQVIDILKLGADDLVGDNILDGEHEIIIEPDIYFQKSRFKGSFYQPPDPDEFEVSDFDVVSVDGLVLSPQDAKRFKAYMGDLTDDELDAIQQNFFDKGYDEPEPPEPDDYDDYRDY